MPIAACIVCEVVLMATWVSHDCLVARCGPGTSRITIKPTIGLAASPDCDKLKGPVQAFTPALNWQRLLRQALTRLLVTHEARVARVAMPELVITGLAIPAEARIADSLKPIQF